MLHLVLPPTPPAIFITLTQSKNVFDKHLNKKKMSLSRQDKHMISASKKAFSSTALKVKTLDYTVDQIQSHYSTATITIATKAQEYVTKFSTNQTIKIALPVSSKIPHSAIKLIANTPPEVKNGNENSTNTTDSTPKATNTKSTNDINPVDKLRGTSTPIDTGTGTITQNIKATNGKFLVGVIINNREVGSLDIRMDANTILVPLQDFAEIASFSVENIEDKTQIKTPLGVVSLPTSSLKKIEGITYISQALLKEKLSTLIEFDAANLALNVNLPWRRDSGNSPQPLSELQPEVIPPLSAFSSLRQELQITNDSRDTRVRSSTLLGGRLAGGSWRVRLNNTFVNQPDVSEYFFYKRTNQFRYQIGRQQVGLHPLLNGMNLTGVQLGYSNLAADRFSQQYGASELLPRRGRPLQTFQGQVPPASFVQLRVGGIVFAQQQVGLNGRYELIDVNLPTGNTNEIELLVYDRNNLSIPIEIRSLNINVSDLLLPAGGNVQLGGLGLSGNLAQDSLFGDYGSESGKLVGFYQLRQGFSDNLTFEGSVQAIPDTVQTQAGFIWRLANPLILASSIGTSRGQLGYTTDLSLNLGRLEVIGNSQSFPNGYNSTNQLRDRFNHSLEAKYRFSNNFSLGFIARSRQDEYTGTSYISPTFSLIPFKSLSLWGRPDLDGRYLFTAFYYPNSSTRLSLNTFGNVYTSDLTYNLNRQYQLSFGSEFGGDLAARYSTTLNYNSPNLNGLNWRVGLAYSDGDVGPVVGASMQVLPALFARVEYQSIPSRSRNLLGGFGDDRLTVLLVSDLSFAGGSVIPARSSGLGQEKGAIGGQIVVEGGKKDLDLSGANIRVISSRNNGVSTAKTDSSGKFFVGNLPEGIYIVELDPDRLPIELATVKTSIVAEVAASAVTPLDFTTRLEYGLAGRITDVAGKPMAQVQVELVNAAGRKVLSAVTDEFGLYRLDGIPIGRYTLRVPNQDGMTSTETFPTREVAINKEFIYDQNLQLPFATATKETKDK
jgi:hypothetical protein